MRTLQHGERPVGPQPLVRQHDLSQQRQAERKEAVMQKAREEEQQLVGRLHHRVTRSAAFAWRMQITCGGRSKTKHGRPSSASYRTAATGRYLPGGG